MALFHWMASHTVKILLFKLRQFGIAGTLYDWLEHYLAARSKKVVINGISSS